jgi:EAL domain-containing protein (putative c-di-GMP-specific phosphodiesterase class I)
VRSTIDLGTTWASGGAEGVETRLVDMLRALGCDDAQGYYMQAAAASKLAHWRARYDVQSLDSSALPPARTPSRRA